MILKTPLFNVDTGGCSKDAIATRLKILEETINAALVTNNNAFMTNREMNDKSTMINSISSDDTKEQTKHGQI